MSPKADVIPNANQQENAGELPKKPKDHTGFLLVLFLIASLGSAAIILFKKQNLAPSPLPARNQVSRPLFLSIKSPANNTTVVKGQVLVTGRTLPSAAVLIYSNSDQTSTDANAAGDFAATVLLDKNTPLVRVTAYSSSGEEVTKTFVISNNKVITDAYSTDVLGKSTDNGDSDKSDSESGHGQGTRDNSPNEKGNSDHNKKESSNTITPVVAPREPVSEPDEVKDSHVKKFLEVEKKTETEHKKLTVEEVEEVENEEKEGSKSAGLEIEKTEVKEASEGAKMQRQAVMGVILSNSGGVIVLAHQIHRDWLYNIYYNANTEISMKDKDASGGAVLVAGMRIAVVGEPTAGGLLAKRIHVIPGLATGIFERFPVASASGTPAATPSGTLSGSPSPTVKLSPTPIPSLTPSPIPTI